MCNVINLSDYMPPKGLRDILELQKKYKDAVSYKETTAILWKNFIHMVSEKMRDLGVLPLFYQNRMGKCDARIIYKLRDDNEYTMTCFCICSLSDNRGLKDGRVRFYKARIDKVSNHVIEVLSEDMSLMTLFDLADNFLFEKCVRKAVDRLQKEYARYN